MRTIDEPRLETDLQYRYDYLAEFIGFGSADAALIQGFAPHLGLRIGEIVDKTHDKLLSYDATARHLVPRQHGYEGDVPGNLADLTTNHPQIRFRKDQWKLLRNHQWTAQRLCRLSAPSTSFCGFRMTSSRVTITRHYQAAVPVAGS